MSGRKTLLLEKKKFPRDKYCAGAVCNTAVEILNEMGIYQQLLDDNKAKIVRTCFSRPHSAVISCYNLMIMTVAALSSITILYTRRTH